MRKIAAIAVLALALTGCASAPDETEAEDTPAAPAETTEGNPNPSPTPGWWYCGELVDGMDAYVDFISDAATGNVDMDEYAVQDKWANSLQNSVPTDGRDELDDYLDPIYQMRDVLADGGGGFTLNTEKFKVGAQTTLEYCTDVIGYSA